MAWQTMEKLEGNALDRWRFMEEKNLKAQKKTDQALSYIPIILNKLTGDEVHMFAEVLQAMREGGYQDGFEDGKKGGRLP